ncbi:sensor histidine kinase [Pseudooceanicola nanhaiensis]|jgi:two-component sensor histidine kinase|uniref:histidine kinase n=1 Tax=Pseudooceanicola nanhaiensis TaxID=375761 RepID=A0A917SVB8_9RHOB|nr:sensor histidine kinase [Pseudooceanicola nanhaiensis]GGL97836.1 histidine kinase [Pseudooceanicola nanhaiensis]
MRKRLFESLGTRVVAMLSIALLPVGLISLYQTSHVIDQADELSRSALIGLTLSTVESQSDLIHEGFAAARVLGGALVPIRNDPEACSELMRGFVRSHPSYSLATFVDSEGQTNCNSESRFADLSGSKTFEQMREEPRRLFTYVDRGAITGGPVILIAQPVYDNMDLIGHITLSLPRENVQLDPNYVEGRTPINVITLNADGEVIMAPGDIDTARSQLPAFRDLTSFLYRRATTFVADDRTGAERIYSVVPIIPGVAIAFAVWEPTDPSANGPLMARAALAFPLLMWAISLIVAYIAVHRLVIRHIRALRRKMREFSTNGVQFVPAGAITRDSAPSELKQMEESFDNMAERITRDTAELENNLHEKNVLLKEVHHRVKNNLQLIASIMNMEIRKARESETRSTLKRVQDRVLGLATVHSNLYHTSRLASLRADSLLHDILGQTLKSALPGEDSVRVEIETDEIVLYPDQAVPLSLLATEAATNAVKYLGRPVDGSLPWVKVTMKELDGGRFRFTMTNSRGTPMHLQGDVPDGTGLGNQLIDAFAMQLGSRTEVTETDESYSLSVVVKISGFTGSKET